MASDIRRGPPRRSPASSPASDDNRADLQNNVDTAENIDSAEYFQWGNQDEGARVIGPVKLYTWRREPGLKPRGVIGFADVGLPRLGICCCRLRSVGDRVWVEYSGSGVAVQWREVNARYAWAIVELITGIDPAARADDGSVPFIPAPPWSPS